MAKTTVKNLIRDSQLRLSLMLQNEDQIEDQEDSTHMTRLNNI